MPYPKYDEAQKDYYSRIEGCEQTCIPTTNVADLEMTGVVLEAMASDSAQHLVPAFYDVMLKSKHTRDNESEEMLEIVFGNRIFDWGDTVYCPELRDGPVSLYSGAHKPQLPKPTHSRLCVPQLESSLCSPQLEKALA